MKRSFLFRVIAADVCLAVMLLFCLPAHALGYTDMEENEGADIECDVFLSYTKLSDDEIELELNVLCEQGICALFAEIAFDSDDWILLSCIGERTEISLVDYGGGVRFLIDGIQNMLGGGVAARFHFKNITGSASGEFELRGACEKWAVGINDHGVPVQLIPSADGILTVGNEKSAVPKLNYAAVGIGADGGAVLRISVSAVEDCFAAGARLFIVDIGRGEHADICIVGVVGNDMYFEGEIPILIEGSACIVITAVGYKRDAELAGDKTVIISNKSKGLSQLDAEFVFFAT